MSKFFNVFLPLGQLDWKEKDERSSTFAGIEMSREEKNQIDFENKNDFISEGKKGATDLLLLLWIQVNKYLIVY